MKSLGKTNTKKAETKEQNKETFGIQQIPNLPFAVVKEAEYKYVVVFGKYMIIDKPFETYEEACMRVTQTDWLPILNVIGIMIDETLKLKENE
jgi:hypothetical protein